jgi:hypothetical protein
MSMDKGILKSYIKVLVKAQMEKCNYIYKGVYQTSDVKSHINAVIENAVERLKYGDTLKEAFHTITGQSIPSKYKVYLNEDDIKYILSLTSVIKRTPVAHKYNPFQETDFLLKKL